MMYKNMSKRITNRIITKNQMIEPTSSLYRKCAHHIYSYSYGANMRKYGEILREATPRLNTIDMDSTVNVKIAFHFMAPRDTYNRERVLSRMHDVISSINDDFNNYTVNANTMNNFKYKSVVNQVFISNMAKQRTYLGQEFLHLLPTKPSNITFELGGYYFYPIKNRLALTPFNDSTEMDMKQQAIKQYIYKHRAMAIDPEHFLNIWVIDMADTAALGFSTFPWESMDGYHGVVAHTRSFFPEDYGETNFHLYKTFSHQIGHYFGLPHELNLDTNIETYAATNLNLDSHVTRNYLEEAQNQFVLLHDPLNQTINGKLHNDMSYNPMFMNFMDYTYDKYVTMFTHDQIQQMRHMISTYRPNLNSLQHNVMLPLPKYNPTTDTFIGTVHAGRPEIPILDLIDEPLENPPLGNPPLGNPSLGNPPLSNTQAIIAEALGPDENNDYDPSGFGVNPNRIHDIPSGFGVNPNRIHDIPSGFGGNPNRIHDIPSGFGGNPNRIHDIPSGFGGNPNRIHDNQQSPYNMQNNQMYYNYPMNYGMYGNGYYNPYQAYANEAYDDGSNNGTRETPEQFVDKPVDIAPQPAFRPGANELNEAYID